MDEILEKYPEFENKLYIIGGPRREALREAMAIFLRLTDRCRLTTEWFCLKDSKDTIKSALGEVAAATGLDKGLRDHFRTQGNGDVGIVRGRILASYRRRFVRMTFIDSLESLHLKGQPYNREDVVKALSDNCPNPIIAVSEEIAPAGPDTVQYNNGTTFSLTVRG